MSDYLSKPALLSMIRTARARWDALLADVPEAWLTEPGVAGEWSVKDIVAHIAWGEREARGLARARALVGSDLWQLSEDERNAIVFEQNRDRELDDVLSESRQAFEQFVEAVAALSEEALNDPHQFSGMPISWRPWRVMYDPHHYEDHAQSIGAWLARRKESEPR